MRKKVILLISLTLCCVTVQTEAVDGIADRVVTRDVGGSLGWYVDTSATNGFGDGIVDDSGLFGAWGDTPLLGDVSGDGIADRIIARNIEGILYFWADYSTATGFGDGVIDTGTCFGGNPHVAHAVKDLNNDGYADIIIVNDTNFPDMYYYLATLSTSSGLGDPNVDYTSPYGDPNQHTLIGMGDLNGDGVADRVIDLWNGGLGAWAGDYGPPTGGFGNGDPNTIGPFGEAGMIPLLGDLNNDGNADRVVVIDGGGYYDWVGNFAPPGGGFGDPNNIDFSQAGRFGRTNDIFLLGDILDPNRVANDNGTIALWHMDAIQYYGLPIDANAVPDDSASVSSFHSRDNHLRFHEGEPVLASGGVAGNALSFDGDDITVAFDAWRGAQLDYDSVGADFCFNPSQIPQGTESDFTVLIGAIAWEIRLYPTANPDEGQLRFITWANEEDGFATVSVVGSQAITVGNWYHVVAEYKDGTQSMTVNEVEVTASQSSLRLYDAGIYVGGDPNNSGHEYSGAIDETKVYVPMMPGPSDGWQSPREDDFSTVGLWHLDERIIKAGDLITTPDDNTNYPSRPTYPGTLMEGNEGTADPNKGPQLISAKSPEFDKCFEFDGLNDKIQMSTEDLGPDDNLRVESWMKLDDSVTQYSSGNCYVSVAQHWRFMMGIEDRADGTWSHYACFWWPDNGGLMVATVTDDPKGWHHVSCQWYKGQVSLYVDGRLRDRTITTESTSLRTDQNEARIGAMGGIYHFWGRIDDVLITWAKGGEEPPCGVYGYPTGDVNKDCYVDFLDLGALADEWLDSPGN